jgi:hypothetical protein
MKGQGMLLTAGCLVAGLCLAVPRAGAADRDELLKKIELLELQLKELKELQQASGEKESHCLQATGVEKFCACLAEKLPREVSFEQYVHTVVTPKKELGYEGLPAERRKVVDQTLTARDGCVEKKKGGLLW